MKYKLLFVVVGYEEKLENGSLRDAVTYEMFAENEEEAFKKAKKIVDKPFYRTSAVYEKETLK